MARKLQWRSLTTDLFAPGFKKNGFIPRADDAGSIREARTGQTKGHDIPVLVRETPRSELGTIFFQIMWVTADKATFRGGG